MSRGHGAIQRAIIDYLIGGDGHAVARNVRELVQGMRPGATSAVYESYRRALAGLRAEGRVLVFDGFLDWRRRGHLFILPETVEQWWPDPKERRRELAKLDNGIVLNFLARARPELPRALRRLP